MKENILIAVLLLAGLLTPLCGWLFYLWYRSHVKNQHQEGQIFGRRNLDRAQANYQPENEPQTLQLGPHFTGHKWIRPKHPQASYGLRQYRACVNTRSPPAPNQQAKVAGNHPSTQQSQGPNQTNAQTLNQQPNPLSKRQQKRQRALQKKQREQEQSQNQQSINTNQRNQHSQKKQEIRNRNNKGQDYQGSNKSRQDQNEHDGVETAEGQNYQHNDSGDGNGHGYTEDQNDQRSVKGWERQDSSGYQNSQKGWGKADSAWGNDERHDEQHTGWTSPRHASPQRASRNPSRTRSGWDNESHQHDHHKESTAYHYHSPQRSPRGRTSPDRDWGLTNQGWAADNPPRSNSWGRGDEHRGGASQTWSQDGNVHQSKKKKKERWQIELEGNEEHRRKHRQSPTQSPYAQDSRHGRSPPRENSVTGWDNSSKPGDWKNNQEW